MNAMMARGIHYSFKPAWHPVDSLGVDPELVDQVEAAADGDHQGMKSKQHQWHREQEPERKRPGPGLSQGG